MSVDNVLRMIQESQAKFVDLRFTDIVGKEQHVSIGAHTVDEDFFTTGKMFDGSSIRGFKAINESDMILMPDATTAMLDPFYNDPTVILRCDVYDPNTMTGYERGPRSLAKRAEEYVKSTGIADTCYFGPEPEFFIFDDVRFKIDIHGAAYQVDSVEGAWNTETHFEGGNIGHRPMVKGGYFPVPPVDSSQDIRSAMCQTMEEMGLVIEAHHHEVATGNQNEIATQFNTLVSKADEMQILKYVVHNTAHIYGKTATFMPKPLVGDNGNGMHVHQSLSKDGENIFAGDKYAGLSDTALYYIGGIIKHARALNAFTNGTTNSYKRLVPGFEAPVLLAYSSRNRSASIRIPYVASPKGRRIEIRFPDPACNPYLAFTAMMMAGLDGIQNKIHPGDPMEKDLYDLPPEELQDVPTVCASLEDALKALDEDREFLLKGDVFSNDLIDAYIKLKQDDVGRVNMTTHPLEFELYYSL
ncbi:MAG: glutamine synthetase [Legionellales bacterium]|nr:glutamine synthetase [Legionellales bacterium]